jgi:hypothetical protein
VISPINPKHVFVGVISFFLINLAAMGILLPILGFKGVFWGGIFYYSTLGIAILIGGIIRFTTISKTIVIPRGLETFSE